MSKKALKRQRKAARAEAAALAAGEIVPPKPLTKAQRRAAKAAAATQSQASEADASAATSAPKPNVAQTVTSSEPALQGNIAGNSQFAASPVGGRTDDVTMSFDAKAVQRVEELAQEDALEGVQSGKPPDHAAESHADSEMENTADLAAYLDRYFPGVTPDQEFCTGCASYGHRLRSCPRLKCQFCGDTEHMGPGCPTRKRCPKCKQLGHPKEKCTEKLALAPGEAMECAFCASKDHTESDCTEFYRSYRPNEYTMRKVKEIPIYCYCCGKKGHYGTECGLSQVPFVKTRSVETWSMENWRLYVDPNSPNYSIELDPASGSGYVADANGRPDFGKSIVPRTHIIFEDDDDDEEEGFLRPPVQREQQQKNGQIKVGRQGHGGFSSLSRQAHNPPLPPGPPPGLPARPPQQSGQASGGVRKRPKKPKPFQQSKQGQGQGQQNGHGGGGGGFSIRGRAGGRGRGGRR
jgi:protein AIR1/2